MAPPVYAGGPFCSWLKMEAARHSAPAETCVGPSQSALVDHGRLASIVRQHCDFRYCLAATLERFFKGFGVGRQQARIMIANLMRRGLSSISALVTDRSLRLPLLFRHPPVPAMERALAHAGRPPTGAALLAAMIFSLTRHPGKFNARVHNRTDLSFELGLGSRSGWPNGAPSLPSSDSHCWGACNE
jgi:hypothetical protein